jgi:SAM-dependent methyltransferase
LRPDRHEDRCFNDTAWKPQATAPRTAISCDQFKRRSIGDAACFHIAKYANRNRRVTRQATRSARARLLSAAFGLLYGPLAAFHEITGRLLFGASWHARRVTLLLDLPRDGLVVDIGCGEGRLLGERALNDVARLGIEPSETMARRARRRGTPVIRGDARQIPIASGVAAAIICSYPGPWIAERETWKEIARITRSGAPVSVLLGGDYRRGNLARCRGLVLRLAYGRGDDIGDPPFVVPDSSLLRGDFVRRVDRWGTALYWLGNRV